MILTVMDTSALISLELIGVIKESLKIVKITVPSEVKNELEEIKKYEDKEGRAADNILKIISSKEIDVVKVKDTKKTDSILSRNINKGEAECLMACIENNIKTLIMDDMDAAYRLEGPAIAGEIKIKISVAILIELYRQKLINKNELRSYVNKMIKIREWEGGALKVMADKYLDNI